MALVSRVKLDGVRSGKLRWPAPRCALAAYAYATLLDPVNETRQSGRSNYQTWLRFGQSCSPMAKLWTERVGCPAGPAGRKKPRGAIPAGLRIWLRLTAGELKARVASRYLRVCV